MDDVVLVEVDQSLELHGSGLARGRKRSRSYLERFLEDESDVLFGHSSIFVAQPSNQIHDWSTVANLQKKTTEGLYAIKKIFMKNVARVAGAVKSIGTPIPRTSVTIPVMRYTAEEGGHGQIYLTKSLSHR